MQASHPTGLRKWRNCCLVLLLCALAFPQSIRAADEDEPDLKEIIQRLNDWRGSFSSVHLVYEWRTPGQLQKYQPQLAASARPEDFRHRHDLRFGNSGWERTESWDFTGFGATLRRHTLSGRNDRLQFSAEFPPSPPDATVPSAMAISPYPGNLIKNYVEEPGPIYPLNELYFPGHRRGTEEHESEWLGNMLSRTSPQITRYAEIDGWRCVGIHRAPESAVTLWLDLEHDCLPRLVEADEPRPAVEKFHVQSFRRLNNGRWFPESGVLTRSYVDDDAWHWVVTEVAVNERVDPELFAPPKAGPETRVTDTIRPGMPVVVSVGGKVISGLPKQSFLKSNPWLVGLVVLGIVAVASICWSRNSQ